MVKKHFAFLILMIICIGLVSAIDTKIDIKTLPNHDVYLSVLNYADSSYTLQIMRNTSDQYGDVYFVYTSSEVPKFDLRVIVKKGEERIHIEEFKKDYPAGTPIYLEVAPEGSEFIETPKTNETNVSLENETLLIEENETEKSGFSGGVISEKIKGIFTNKIFYYALGIVVLGIFVLVLRGRKSKGAREIKVRKLSEINSEKDEHEKKSAEVSAAERRLKGAQEELNRLKNADKIEEMEHKLKEQQKELERLKKGGD